MPAPESIESAQPEILENDASSLLERRGIDLALIVALVAMLGSLYFSEVRGYEPCRLCWYQRFLMYPISFIVAIGIWRGARRTPLFFLPLALIGIPLSTYHYLIQRTNWFSDATACQAGVPCSVMYIDWMGFITIPFLALTAFLLIALSGSASLRGAVEMEPDAPRRKRLIATVVAIALIFAILRALGV